MEENIQTSFGHVRVMSLEEVRGLDAWRQVFAGLAKDHRYYELVDETLRGDFEFRYLVVEDYAKQTIGIQPFFLVEQDLVMTAPAWLRALVGAFRFLSPRLLRLKMLMIGCAAGEAHPGANGTHNQHALVSAVAEAVSAIARKHRASLIVWKDFPATYRAIMRATRGVRLASMPATRLDLQFADFEEYLQRRLSHATRKDLRRKFKATAERAVEMSVMHSVAENVDEVHGLYRQVLARSALQFERLPRDFFLQLGNHMSDRVRFFLWRDGGRLVACSVCLLHDGVLYDEYLGLDYRVALDWHLYFVTLRDVLTWAMRNGVREYRSAPLNYSPKRQLGFGLAPLDLYVRHRSPALHALLRLALPILGPTRAEPVLRSFPNAAEL